MGPNRTRQPELILTREQTTCLVSTVRQELLSGFIRYGPAPVDEIAGKIGKRAKSLYYHVELMEEVGLLRKVGMQPAAKRPEAIYDVVAERVVYDSAHEEEVRKSIQGLVRTVGRELERSPREEEPAVIRISSRLSKKDRDELVKRMGEIALWAKGKDDPNQKRVSLTQFMAPLE